MKKTGTSGRRLLLVEDESRLADALQVLLSREGYTVDLCPDGLSGLNAILANSYQAAILDVMLPGISGFEIVKKVRETGISTPVLILTARSEVDDKVRGLDCGADDYLTKPFETREFLARLRALERRGKKDHPETLSLYDLSLDPASFTLTCTRNSQSVRLSKKEYQILEMFMENPGRVLSREQLAVKIWGYDSESEYNNVEVYLSFTRKKLAFIESSAKIKALRGLGYELREKNV
ncbi:MAG: response regulator transcription factor [Clostridiales bacterium]|nr:response regulator transcription factor [Clostridiales bacterium]